MDSRVADAVDDLRTLEVQRLDALQVAVWDKAMARRVGRPSQRRWCSIPRIWWRARRKHKRETWVADVGLWTRQRCCASGDRIADSSFKRNLGHSTPGGTLDLLKGLLLLSESRRYSPDSAPPSLSQQGHPSCGRPVPQLPAARRWIEVNLGGTRFRP